MKSMKRIKSLKHSNQCEVSHGKEITSAFIQQTIKIEIRPLRHRHWNHAKFLILNITLLLITILFPLNILFFICPTCATKCGIIEDYFTTFFVLCCEH